MRKITGDNFCENIKYKLYRGVYEVLHPTISKKNISSYKVVLDEKILPILAFYPKKVSSIDSVIIYIPGNGKVNGSYGKYSDICNNLAKKCDRLVVAIDYFDKNIKYPATFDCVYDSVLYLIKNLQDNGISLGKIALMGDSTGANIVGGIVSRLVENKIYIKNQILIYPVVKSRYLEFDPIDVNVTMNNNFDKRLVSYMNKYVTKRNVNNCEVDLMNRSDYNNYPRTLIITGNLDILKDDGFEYSKKLIESDIECVYHNIKFAVHGFLGGNDQELIQEMYIKLEEFIK